MDVHVQSHICEQKPEVKFTLELFPDHEHCAAIFERAGLLTNKVWNIHFVAHSLHTACETLEDMEYL